MRPTLNKAFEEEMRRRIEEVRKTIKISEIVGELQACVMGEKILTKEQIRSAEIVLKKAMPDMKEIEHTGSVTHEAGESIQEILIRAVDANRSTTQGG